MIPVVKRLHNRGRLHNVARLHRLGILLYRVHGIQSSVVISSYGIVHGQHSRHGRVHGQHSTKQPNGSIFFSPPSNLTNYIIWGVFNKHFYFPKSI